MTIAQHIPDPIKRASRSIGYALWLDHTAAYANLATVLMARLSERQLAGLAWAALRALDPDTAYAVADLAIFGPSEHEEAA